MSPNSGDNPPPPRSTTSSSSGEKTPLLPVDNNGVTTTTSSNGNITGVGVGGGVLSYNTSTEKSVKKKNNNNVPKTPNNSLVVVSSSSSTTITNNKEEMIPLVVSRDLKTRTKDNNKNNKCLDDDDYDDDDDDNIRKSIYNFLEARTIYGSRYETFMIVLILLNVLAFVLGTLFVSEYNDVPYAHTLCGSKCDAIWFGNYENNDLQFLGIGPTSLLEIFTVLVFTVDYILRVWTADFEKERYKGFLGRILYIPSFFSLVDLASTLPFYIDIALVNTNLAASQFLRMFRLFRTMRVEGRYDTALTMFDDVFYEQRDILGTALFVGTTTWIAVSSFYYLTERKSTDSIYCGSAPYELCGDVDDIDTSLCIIDNWGFVDCTNAGCPSSIEYPEPCYNLFRSILSSSYFSLLNLFGEFPLIDQHSNMGKVVGTLTAVVAVAVFALPAGIIGNGFEDILERKRNEREFKEKEELLLLAAAAQEEEEEDDEEKTQRKKQEEQEEQQGQYGATTTGRCTIITGNTQTWNGKLYNFLHLQTTSNSQLYDHLLNFFVFGTTLTFFLSTIDSLHRLSSPTILKAFDIFETIAVIAFTVDYILKLICINEDPKYNREGWLWGRLLYMIQFLPLVDLVSFAPFWIFYTKRSTLFVRCLRVLRILRFERYTKAFTTFDDVLSVYKDILIVTGFTACIMWIFFSAILYFTERDSSNDEIRMYYKTVPHAMWITLLNLSGESPLCHYSVYGKIVTGIIGLFATGLFGIPIGILGAGFEEVASENAPDTPDDDDDDENVVMVVETGEAVTTTSGGGGGEETTNNYVKINNKCSSSSTGGGGGGGYAKQLYLFVNGMGNTASSKYFEMTIYALIIVTVFIGIIQTVEGMENTLHQLEWFAVIVFTLEYLLRFIGSSADPEFAFAFAAADASWGSGWLSRMRFVFSFYSIVDLAAIVPLYLAQMMPGSWVDKHDEYLRMLRLLRLLKLDKYVPSITLIDDVIRLKWNMLKVTGFASITLWILFASFIFLIEHDDDTSNGIDDVPVYGCDSDCTMSDRFRNAFDSLIYTGIHLTGDYPIIEYALSSRFICFFMVIAAVGVVSVPSGLIASGFAEIVQSRTRSRRGRGRFTRSNNNNARSTPDAAPAAAPGDDWYEFRLNQLTRCHVEPPHSTFGTKIDHLQSVVHEFLNGTIHPITQEKTWTLMSLFGRVFIFVIIIANVIAVILESIPEIDCKVGNESGNVFDIFEFVSVMIFTVEYLLRLFSAEKNRDALYSPWVYATTFYGLVDLLSTAPWYVQHILESFDLLQEGSDNAKIFRIFRIFRILQLEDFIVAFSKLDNVFRASKDVLKATGLMALIIWVGCGACFFIFEQSNPNFRSCDSSIPLRDTFVEEESTNYYSTNNNKTTTVVSKFMPGCYDFETVHECNEYYGVGSCEQTAFVNMPDSLFYTAVFLCGEWGFVDFTWYGRLVCMFLCIAGIGLYAIPTGTLFDSFGVVLGMCDDEDEDDDEEE